MNIRPPTAGPVPAGRNGRRVPHGSAMAGLVGALLAVASLPAIPAVAAGSGLTVRVPTPPGCPGSVSVQVQGASAQAGQVLVLAEGHETLARPGAVPAGPGGCGLFVWHRFSGTWTRVADPDTGTAWRGISRDGSTALFTRTRAGSQQPADQVLVDVATGATHVVPPGPRLGPGSVFSASGRQVFSPSPVDAGGVVYDRTADRVRTLALGSELVAPLGVSDDGSVVAFYDRADDGSGQDVGASLSVRGRLVRLGAGVDRVQLSSDGRVVLYERLLVDGQRLSHDLLLCATDGSGCRTLLSVGDGRVSAFRDPHLAADDGTVEVSAVADALPGAGFQVFAMRPGSPPVRASLPPAGTRFGPGVGDGAGQGISPDGGVVWFSVEQASSPAPRAFLRVL